MELRFDFADDDTTTGFRLDEFSLYNWGTYDKQIIKLTLAKYNALLTGDIGSGKSTIVDALTTLLVPHQKITFNKAAGAESKERTLRSYILGEYKSAQDETLKNAKAVALRDESSFSVLMARFYNDGYGESFSVAQFFHIKNKQVQKFFITSKSELGIKDDFLDLEFKDIRMLKKYLRSKAHTNVYDSFSEYSKDFKRSMGIKNDQALNLFYQTVSLKSIGNLTSFVREHMLESSDIDTKIDELCKNFAELNHSHTLVLRAKEQIELLTPIDKEGEVYEKNTELKEQNEAMRNGLSSYFASLKTTLLKTKIDSLLQDIQKNTSAKDTVAQALKKDNKDEVDLRVELQKNGGERVKILTQEIQIATKELEEKKAQHKKYNELAKELSLSSVSNENRFLNNQKNAQEHLDNIEEQKTKYTNDIVINSSAKSRYEEKEFDLGNEITYLEQNRSNIPKYLSSLRDKIAKELNLHVEALPFAGELIEVQDEEWKGAIHRVMHSFSLSLLVDEEYYQKLSEYINQTNLGVKLVYLKINKTIKKRDYYEVTKNSLLQKVKIKADSSYYDAVLGMIQERFDIACVENIAEFRKHKKALTQSGQFKSNYARHEKDDRYDIGDTKRWTLGWDNTQKLNALKEEFITLKEKILYLSDAIKLSQNKLDLIEYQRDNLRDLLQFKSFESINWYIQAKNIEQYKEELIELQESSDVLQTLNTQLDKLVNKIKDLKEKEEFYIGKISSSSTKIDSHKEEIQILESIEKLEESMQKSISKLFELSVEKELNLNNIAQKERELRTKLQQSIDKIIRKITASSQNILSQMNNYTTLFSVESKEFDASISSLNDFRVKLKELKKDDLPRFEKRFKELFKEKTIQKTAMIQADLEHQSKEIESKIAKINDSLKAIEYNSGTYIALVAEKSNIREIRDFKQDLKSAISYAISDDNSYDEAKFLQIKELIDRFNGREGYSEVDKRWRALVSDVRNWFDFSASERYISDASEKEYYAHSGGKSGGQKEKLAYTVLASSLAFQFGLEYNEVRSKSFRFVMIDEAFGKGSDESTKYALRLFEKLNLQLLVITPKTKINVIEPFVKSVHFVHNQDGMNSSLISMQIQEYQKKKKV